MNNGIRSRLWLLRAMLVFAATQILFSLVLTSEARAATRVDHYQTVHDGMTLQISAPRADIIRIRVGSDGLPEDASWAVSAAVRGNLQTMEVTQTSSQIELMTNSMVVQLDTASLHLRIVDRLGRVVLEDAPGPALVLDRLAGDGRTGVHLRKAMPGDEHYFGLGDKAGPLDRRGETFTLWNSDAFGFAESSDPLYKSIPFVLGVRESGGSVGLFFDNTWRSYFDFGRTERNTLAIGAEGGAVDYYVMSGSDPKSVVQAYAYLTGTAPLAPLWALGFQQSRYSYATDTEARAIATRLRADHIPADAIYLDIDYQDRNRPFTVSHDAFPDLPTLVADLESMDMRLILITDLHIADAPNQGYAPYDSGAADGMFLRRADGSTYVAEVWPGKSVFPDFSRAQVRDWWGGLYTDFVHAGVAGFWNDMNEPAIFNVPELTMPLDVLHRIDEAGFQRRDATHAEMHNVYGMLNSEATFTGLQRLRPDERPFVLTRASYAGGQRFAATWTGDNTSSWNHLRLSISMLTNLGLSGFAYSGDDIGGFAGSGPSPELLTRWIEVGAFNPIFRDHAMKGKPAQEPWTGGAAQEAIRKRYIEERYRLMPYIYALAEENSRTGLPLMRPVFLEFPDQLSRPGALGGSADQFMLGPDLLVAPAPVGESPFPYTIVLPGPGWYDYWSGQPVPRSELSENPRIERLPVFVRPGSIVPRQPLVQSTRQTPKGPLELAIYPGPDCHGQLYFDDGISLAYQKGAYLRQTLRCTADAQRMTLRWEPREGNYHAWWSKIALTFHGVTRPPHDIRLNDVAIPSRYDAAKHTLSIDVPDQSRAAQVIVDTGS